MLELFNLGNAEHAELLNNINWQVNEAIETAISKGMYSATVNIKVDVSLRTVNGEDGRTVLAPEFEHKIKTKIGGSWEGAKGKSQGAVGLYRDQQGFWREKFLGQQMTMEGVS